MAHWDVEFADAKNATIIWWPGWFLRLFGVQPKRHVLLRLDYKDGSKEWTYVTTGRKLERSYGDNVDVDAALLRMLEAQPFTRHELPEARVHVDQG